MTVRNTATQLVLILAVVVSTGEFCCASDPLAKSAHGFAGSSSCATASCHGGARSLEGHRFAAYQIWIHKDPHARAYEVLNDPRSIRMMNLLYPDDAEGSHRATEDKSCLSCHATGVDYLSSEPLTSEEKMMASDGVSCEACHGPAEVWLPLHYGPRWKGLDLSQKQSTGFVETASDLTGRVQMCVDCHVGGPGRDVNHDLIAAGHPRLDFEFSTFHANLPRHWDVDVPGDAGMPRIENDRSFEAKGWAAGQLVSARASLRLLNHRTSRIWPELAEYSCYSCHHDLSDRNWRSWKRSSGGHFVWGTWHLDHLDTVQQMLNGSSPLSSMQELRQLMRKPYPDPASVRTLTAAVDKQLTGWIELASDMNVSPADLNRLNAQLVTQGLSDEVTTQSWDQTVQLYLAVVALSLAGQQNDPSSLVFPPVQQDLETIRRQLLFGPDHDSPVRYNTSRIEVIQQKLRAIEERLQVSQQ